ncbi:DUF2975 domain-containing protein [Tenacibaculum jejuense]|uniref:DUF2975 domain-containing protein n=1 Tax=Tenacibaculum jejuense TaxID=584609 RepID=A0A238U4Z9_9FLAO|nr:DUF2975 domain-containing protein [Tenacibaculum jejuense]SNR14115.1 conserved membrane protein of unknown function [Tenacibaculum jejuense]
MKTALNLLKIIVLLFIISLSIDSVRKVFHFIQHIVNGGQKIEIFKIQLTDHFNTNLYHFFLATVILLGLYLLYLLFSFKTVISNFINDTIFTPENCDRLKKIGNGLIIYATVLIVLEIFFRGFLGLNEIRFSNDPAVNLGYNLGYASATIIKQKLPIFLIALFIQFISYVLVKGNVLQQENDLTI